MIDRFEYALPAPTSQPVKPRQNSGKQDAFTLLLSEPGSNALLSSGDANELNPVISNQDGLIEVGLVEGFLEPVIDSENEQLISDQILLQEGQRIESPDISRLALDAFESNVSVVSINKQIQNAGDKLELISSPWRLIANAGLSYQSSSANLLQGSYNPANNATAASLATNSELKTIRASTLNAFSESIAIAVEKNLPSSWVNQAFNNTSKLAQAFKVTRKTSVESNASSILWPKRALHFVSDSEGGTAWVRDYQLEKNDVEKLFSSIRCAAEQQNFTLRRIMLNGHEVWRAPSTL
jgi:hypothetical protein